MSIEEVLSEADFLNGLTERLLVRNELAKIKRFFTLKDSRKEKERLLETRINCSTCVSGCANVYDLQDRTLFNATPLHVAVVFGHVELVRFLLEQGAQVEAFGGRDIYGGGAFEGTALHMACFDRYEYTGVGFIPTDLATSPYVGAIMMDTGWTANDIPRLLALEPEVRRTHAALITSSLQIIGLLLDFGARVDANRRLCCSNSMLTQTQTMATHTHTRTQTHREITAGENEAGAQGGGGGQGGQRQGRREEDGGRGSGGGGKGKGRGKGIGGPTQPQQHHTQPPTPPSSPTPLFHAARSNFVEAAALLLEKGADANARVSLLVC